MVDVACASGTLEAAATTVGDAKFCAVVTVAVFVDADDDVLDVEDEEDTDVPSPFRS